MEVVHNRRTYVDNFFAELLRHKAIMCYELTESFLKLADAKEFEAAMTAETQKPKPNHVKDMLHIEGIVAIYLD